MNHNALYRARMTSRTDAEITAKRATMRPAGLKRCSQCREHLPLTAFHSDRTKPDGLYNKCKACGSALSILPSLVELAELLDLWACNYCGASDDLCREHIVPVSVGGTHDVSNLTVACRVCNHRKRSEDGYSYFARISSAA